MLFTLGTWVKCNCYIQVFLIMYCFITLILKCNQVYSNIIHIFYIFHESFFPGTDTYPTHVMKRDPGPATWPDLSNLIDWGHKILSISR